MNLLSYALLYHTYKLPVSRFFRIIFVLVMSGIIVANFLNHMFARGPLFFLSLFFISEVVYRFKVLKSTPKVTVAQNTGKDIYSSFSLQALDSFFFAHDIKGIVKNLLKTNSVRFVLYKANITPGELIFTEVSKDQIAQKAMDLVKNLNGRFITRMDLLSAILLLAEPQTQLLFSKHLKEEEFLHILFWSRSEFPLEESPVRKRVLFYGEGLFDSFTTGWSLETKKYTSDITYKVLDEKPILIGRRKEFDQMVTVLSRPSKDNALLVGEPGAGKTSLVEALALNSYLGLIPGPLAHKRVYELRVGLLVAGVKEMGDLSARLESILEELSHAGNVILYIADLENILGSQTFHLDLTGVLIPYLRGKHVPVIATISAAAQRNYVESMQAFADLFEIVRIDELNRDDAIQMLLEKASEIEEKNRVTITFKAITASVDLCHKYLQNSVLPGSAVSLLDSAAATKNSKNAIVDEPDVIAKIEEKTHVAIATPGETEKNLLLHMEEKLHERIIDQSEAVSAIAEAIRRLRSGITSQTRPISFLFLGPTGVGKTETAKALATVYFGGENKIIRLDMSEYTSNDSINRLLGSAPGGGSEKGELTEKIYENPFSLVLLDEFEKAHIEILDLFLQVFEDGRLTDNHGKTVSFTNTIVIATSNAGALYIQQQLAQGKQIDKQFKQLLLEEVEKEHLFKPELLNRFDDIIVFKPLTLEQIQSIARLYLQQVAKKLLEQDITITFDQQVEKLAAQEGFDPQFGARPLRRYIQDKIEDAIARAMLEGSIVRGAHIIVHVDDSGSISFQPASV